MTRSRRDTRALSARAGERVGAGVVSEPASMKFLVLEDNGGGYHWAIVAANGDRLVQSTSFASYEEAKRAADIVRRGAGSAPFEDRADDSAPVDLAARRERATVRDGLDAERWLDEGGSFSSEAVRRWPAAR